MVREVFSLVFDKIEWSLHSLSYAILRNSPYNNFNHKGWGIAMGGGDMWELTSHRFSERVD